MAKGNVSVGSQEWFENFDSSVPQLPEHVLLHRKMEREGLIKQRTLIKQAKAQWTGGVTKNVIPAIIDKLVNPNSKFFKPEFAEVVAEIIAELPDVISEEDTAHAADVQKWSEEEAKLNRLLNDKGEEDDREVRVPGRQNVYRSKFDAGKALLRTWLGCITLHRVLTGIAGAPPQWKAVLPPEGSRTRGSLSVVLENHIRRSPAPELFIQSLFGVNAPKVFPSYQAPQTATWGSRTAGLGGASPGFKPRETTNPGYITQEMLTASLKEAIHGKPPEVTPAPVQPAPTPVVMPPVQPVFSLKGALAMLKAENIPLPDAEVVAEWGSNEDVTDYVMSTLEGKPLTKEVLTLLRKLG